jgi:hypothetical protein
MSSATEKQACNWNERAGNQTAFHQRTPRYHSIHVHDPLGINVPGPVLSMESDQNEYAHTDTQRLSVVNLRFPRFIADTRQRRLDSDRRMADIRLRLPGMITDR